MEDAAFAEPMKSGAQVLHAHPYLFVGLANHLHLPNAECHETTGHGSSGAESAALVVARRPTPIYILDATATNGMESAAWRSPPIAQYLAPATVCNPRYNPGER